MARILILDTEDSLAPVYKRELEGEGHEVLRASTSCEVFRLIEERKPDLVVLGIELPGWDGMDRWARLLVRRPWIIMRTESSETSPTWITSTHMMKSAHRRELWLKLRALRALRALLAARAA